jgi:intracellular septation protein
MQMQTPPNPKQVALSFFFAGLLPVIAFTVIEETYGTVAGLIAGLIFGCGEIIYEWFRYRKISKITWFGNGLLIGLGLISLISSEGIWFKLQPAIMEAAFSLALWGSLLTKKSLLQWMMEMQGQNPPPLILPRLKGLCFRLGGFFMGHALLATWAAFAWSSQNWALLKGLGLTISFVVYLVLEGLWIRRSIKKQFVGQTDTKFDRQKLTAIKDPPNL